MARVFMKHDLYKVFFCLFLIFGLTVFLSGCGDDSLLDDVDGEVAEEELFSSVLIQGFSDVTHIHLDANGEPIYDTVTVGLKGASDTADANCFFLTYPTTPVTGIQIVTNSASCTSLNKCIVCTKTSGATCSISCSGTVPSNAQTASDYVTIVHKVNSIFTTDIHDPATLLRYDGRAISWPEFDPSHSSLGITWTTSNCDANASTGLNQVEMEAVEDDPLLIFYEDGDEWHSSWSIVDYGDVQQCWIEQRMTARMYLTGAEVPGSTVDLTRGTIQISSKICDTTTCPAPW